MAYTRPPEKTVGYMVQASDLNTYLKDNFEASIPDIITNKGQLVFATAADAAGALNVGSNGTLVQANTGEATGAEWVAPGTFAAGASYRKNAAQTIANNTVTIVNFNASDWDAGSVVTTGASWKFTVPVGQDGYYFIRAGVLFNQTSVWDDNGETVVLRLFKNNGAAGYLSPSSYAHSDASGGYRMFVMGATVQALAAADYVDVRVSQISDQSLDISADGNYTHVEIVRVY